eukprot:TRINITY_DN34665_c0_g1_i1.p2 TRINITY_DN34665_c0_g1~~TRINITY_DN34665_c0_g1_i1.p2  ORF type:complete len:111 (-),score=4.48 TRINITY_DN34665_c0_g1_i1:332-664(-)
MILQRFFKPRIIPALRQPESLWQMAEGCKEGLYPQLHLRIDCSWIILVKREISVGCSGGCKLQMTTHFQCLETLEDISTISVLEIPQILSCLVEIELSHLKELRLFLGTA